ncbi:ATP-binding protein [Candidatus Micrarchaeota archaeon]|nr:ATP-binding protein [Candidatus Micrarchaeota archaeon]
MYFTIEPKSRKEDLFNYEEEYATVKKALKAGERIIVIVGVRRVGKTSLMNVVYNEIKGLKLWIDGRIVISPKKEVPSAIYEVAKNGKDKVFGRIEGLTFSIMGIGLDVRVNKRSFTTMERTIRNAGRITVFIDEAQRMDPYELADILSYFYDRVPNVRFILSGSEVGLLEHVTGEKDPQHPLFGRRITKVILKRLDRSRSQEYLKEGFKQINMKVSEKEIDRVVDELDGLIGWLTLYGYERGVLKKRNAFESTRELAIRVVASELDSFLRRLRNRKLYIAIIRNANGVSWSELNAYVNRDLRKRINPNSLNTALKRLLDYSFIIKADDRYWRADPLILPATFLISG